MLVSFSVNVSFKDVQNQLCEQSKKLTVLETQVQHMLKQHQDHPKEVQQLEDSLSNKLKKE